MTQRLVIGSRGSRLALWQSEFARQALLSCHPDLEADIKVISTQGDRIVDVALAEIGDKALFTKEIEQELLAGTIDLAVHSLKDLQSQLPQGLSLGAMLERHDPHDALVSRHNLSLMELPQGAMVGTGSPRRKAQLLHLRPDLEIRDLRGNVETRLHKLERGDYAAIILAQAGLDRLGLGHRTTMTLPFSLFLPPAGQGIVALQIRTDDQATQQLLAPVHHELTGQIALAERTCLQLLEGGCHAPIAVHARLEEQLTLYGLIASCDGQRIVRERLTGAPATARQLGEDLASKLLAAARDLLIESRLASSS